MRNLSLAAAFAVLAATPVMALAQDASTPTAKPAKPAKADDGDKKICRRMNTSGSRLGGPLECRTKTQWRETEQNQNVDLRNMPGNTGPR